MLEESTKVNSGVIQLCAQCMNANTYRLLLTIETKLSLSSAKETLSNLFGFESDGQNKITVSADFC